MNKFLAIVVLLVLLVVPSAGENLRILAQWEFTEAGNFGGWAPGNGIEGAEVRDGCLVGKTVWRDPLITGPSVSLPAKPSQYVEIRMKSSADGWGELFYTNTTEQPYGGFRPEKMQRIEYKAGDFRVYRIYPFWQSEKLILRLRLDPPEDADFALDYIRVIEVDSGLTTRAFFDFTRLDQRWVSHQPYGSIDDEWMLLGGDEEIVLFSPRLDFDAEDCSWLSLQAQFFGVEHVTLQWVTDDLPGVQSLVIRPGEYRSLRVYNIRAEEIPEWTGRIRRFVLRVPPCEGKGISVGFVGASDKPMGPAQIEVTRFGARDAINRMGKTAVVQAMLTNSGGETAREVEATLRLPERGVQLVLSPDSAHATIEGSARQKIARLGAGETRALEWEVNARGEGELRARIHVTAANAGVTSDEAVLRWHPAVHVQNASYVPEPKPVRGEFEVGVYYYPGWPSYTKWSVLDDFPERRPILGYYHEGDPEVADWHIKWMLEHGITFIIYDWYWSAGSRHLEHAIHEGLFNARYREVIKFCLLWANHNPEGTSSAEDMVNVTNYWLDNYFLLENYVKVDGKPVVVIFSPLRLTDDMGVEGVRAAFEKSRQMARACGLEGIYFVACSYPGRGGLEVLEREGYDAVSGYNYPSAGDNGQLVAPYADMVSGYSEFWKSIQDNTSLRYIPVTEPGWDARPWHGPDTRVRTGKSPVLFERMLRNAKGFVEERSPDAREKIVIIEAWNEFGEGDYIEPHQEWAFEYLDAVRAVFAQADEPHEDIIPSDVGLGPYDLRKPLPVTSWQFDDPKHAGWDATQHLGESRVEDGILRAVSTGPDPALYGELTELDSRRFGIVEVGMRVDKGRTGQLFWAQRARGFSEALSLKFDLSADGEFHVYRLDVGSVATWKGEINRLRLDPTDEQGARVEVDYLSMVEGRNQ
ncbi:MAG: glycoside hydrolase family 99-like domain-containing protein [Armatimonadetes bacterium]|nr:glycoside hydrolase family 99-like domain-containing protein [Armatimonadota bacterium]